MAASQTELPYCSDKGKGKERGREGGAQEVDTPAPAAGATATTRQQTTELDSCTSPASLPEGAEGISGLFESMRGQ